MNSCWVTLTLVVLSCLAVAGLYITSTYARAFLGRYLQGESSPLLTGSSAEFPEVYLRSLRVHD